MALALSRTVGLVRRLGAQAQPQLGGALGRRHSHTRRRAAEVIEVEAAGPSTAADSANKKRLEEAIDGVMARMAQPAWAPFRPGTSYFVPPRPAGMTCGLLALLSHGGWMELESLRPGLSVDEARAVAAASRGYPCSTYFIDGHFPDEVESSRLDDANQAQEE